MLREDLARKAKFLEIFAARRVVGSALRELFIPRSMFRGWMDRDAEFRQEFSDACDDINDELLELALMEAGVLKKPRGGLKSIDRTILLALLKTHSRLRDGGAGEGSGNATIVINIKGADPAKLLKVVGGEALPEIPAGLTEKQAKLLDGPAVEATA